MTALVGLLSDAERRRMERKRIDAKRFEYVTGQAMLRRFISHALDVPPHEIHYARGHKGKPWVEAKPGEHRVQFNISHSGGQVLLALGRAAELGIDLERINPRTGCERVARRAFSEREQAQLSGAPDKIRRRFFGMWTCKEAVVKCSGDGIHSGMPRFSIELSADGSQAYISEAHGNQRKVLDYQVAPLPVGPDFAAALVHEGPPREIELWQLSADALLINP